VLFRSSLDDLMIFNRTLTTSEIVSLYNASRLYHNNITLSEGKHNFTVYTQDLAGNVNYSYSNFTIDLTYPIVNITYPLNITYNINVNVINYTIVDNNPSKCWYSTNLGVTNSTPAVNARTNFSSVSTNLGSNTIIVYCNDSVGNTNSSNVTFTREAAPQYSVY
jgi:hypothetical protein